LTLNYIWIAFFVLAFVAAMLQWIFTGNSEVFKTVIDSTFSSSKMAVMDLALPLVGVMSLWLGLMSIGERAGAVGFLARIAGPFFSRLFPEIPKNHPVTGQLLMNFSANMLGLDNAATPLGLKAMNGLQELNPKKDVASNAQIMFLVLNTSSLTIIPVSIFAQRAILGAANPTDVFIPILIATACSTLAGMIYVCVRQRIKLFDPVIMAWLGGIIAFVALAVVGFARMSESRLEAVSKLASNLILFGIIIAFMTAAIVRRVNAFEAFIEGAKRGFAIMIKVTPYLVGMIVGIAAFRASGAMDFLIDGLSSGLKSLGIDAAFTPALPTALMKPLSGSGARAMMIETMSACGADSFVGRLSCVFQGAADTTFYIIALYFGAAGIRKTRYAIAGGLIADLVGVIAAIAVCYLFFNYEL
jgi:spore maturation protein SpmA